MSSEDILNPPRGMRDVTGVEAELQEYLFELFKETSRKHGFKPIITPTVEYFKLFEAKSGEEIKKSMYVFQDKAGRTLALRPEVTASIIRAYLRGMRGLPKPIRLYYVAQCFRYEEPQKARYREFWQGGLEVIGDPDVNADLSAAFTASSFLEKLGVKHYYVVGNVALHRALLNGIGLTVDEQDQVLHLIDKDRVSDAVKLVLEKTGREEHAEILLKLLESSMDDALNLLKDAGILRGEEYSSVEASMEATREFIEQLKELGFQAIYEPRLVRGLAYYTGLIFEYKATGGLDVSIGGGGRYDGLTRVYGGEYEYSTGLALGLDRVALLLAPENVLPRRISVVIVMLEDVPLKAGYNLLRKLAEEDLTLIPYRTRSISRALSYASRLNADIAVVIGRRELESKSLTVKNLHTGEQVAIELDSGDKLLEWIKKTNRSKPST
ncbi:MAG: histidine--tRNA ligase [Desulfurococcus sp.]|nr:histidine--tRNA ligase [Desulfurococcus sp.]